MRLEQHPIHLNRNEVKRGLKNDSLLKEWKKRDTNFRISYNSSAEETPILRSFKSRISSLQLHLILPVLTKISFVNIKKSVSSLMNLRSVVVSWNEDILEYSDDFQLYELISLLLCPLVHLIRACYVTCFYMDYDPFEDGVHEIGLVHFEKLLLLNKKSAFYFAPRLFSRNEKSATHRGMKHVSHYIRYRRYLTRSEATILDKEILSASITYRLPPFLESIFQRELNQSS